MESVVDERRMVRYRGNVQGVGFRWQAARALKGVAVTGYVMNLPDGSVELVVEGAPNAVRDAAARIESALGTYIRDRSEAVCDATGEFRSFAIRRF